MHGKFQSDSGDMLKGSPLYWRIELGGDSCRVQDLDGLLYISRLIGNGNRKYIWTGSGRGVQKECLVLSTSQILGAVGAGDVFGEDAGDVKDSFAEYGKEFEGGFQSSETRQAMRAAAPAKVQNAITELSRKAKEAHANGDRDRYDDLQLQIVAARKYASETSGALGKSRAFPDQVSRHGDSVRKAIDRAIAAIRKQSPVIADHFKLTIGHSGGDWFYSEPEIAWDRSPLPLPAARDPEPPDEATKIRDSWTADTAEVAEFRRHRTYENEELVLKAFKSIGRPRRFVDCDSDPVVRQVLASIREQLAATNRK